MIRERETTPIVLNPSCIGLQGREQRPSVVASVKRHGRIALVMVIFRKLSTLIAGTVTRAKEQNQRVTQPIAGECLPTVVAVEVKEGCLPSGIIHHISNSWVLRIKAIGLFRSTTSTGKMRRIW